MEHTVAEALAPRLADEQQARLDRLLHAIEHAGHLLPAQGPITVFIHHNTLHAFEDQPFDDAVRHAAETFNCQPYLAEQVYRGKLAEGRFRPEDLAAALLEDLGDRADQLVLRFGTRYSLRQAMLEHPLRMGSTAELRWFVAETGALAQFRGDIARTARDRYLQETRRWVMRDLYQARDADSHGQPEDRGRRMRAVFEALFREFDGASIETWSDSTWEAFTLHVLWRICRDGMHGLKPPSAPHAPLRHRDALLEATGADSDLLVHELLVRFTAAFLDQGMAHWRLPHREDGFWRAFLAIYGSASRMSDRWLQELPREIQRIERAGLPPLDSIQESLHMLGVGPEEEDEYVAATLLALRGFGGMVRQLEQRGDRAAHPAPAGSLVEFLAARLLLERLALTHAASESLGYAGPLKGLRAAARAKAARAPSIEVEQRAFQIFELAQIRGWLPESLALLTKPEWATLVAEIESFPSLERRRVFHHAFERRYRIQTLDAIAVRARRPTPAPSVPRYQVVCCIDEREESFRRHLEEIAPDVETFGVAGFFSVAMYYRGVADAHFVPLCPVVIRPRHYVSECAPYTFEDSHRRRASTRRWLGAASHQFHVGSRTFTGGALLATVLGPLASIPLVARILFPRLTARIRRTAGRLVEPPPITQLQLERNGETPGPELERQGYTVDEMTSVAERLLRDVGMTSGWSRLVTVMGHGSSSLNNPHESAHDCGACGGGRGGPNARAFSLMANDPRVRDLLAKRGLALPPDTHFVGAYHNTCDESVTYFDLDQLPATHRQLFEEARREIDQARARNAHERCRRFESAPLDLAPEDALVHVEERAEDLAQVRPEYGHATNAVAYVGRRNRTRGLYLDRRTFLISYDPTQDDAENAILTRILQAVVPVCAGINLEYYFSFVDPTGWGCGTKLPHNITSLVGVMDGAASDLRPGLPWQMVEVHDPVRLLFIIETTPEAMLQVMERQPAIGQMCRNAWVQLATLSPVSDEIHLFQGDRFERYAPEQGELPVVRQSIDWYRGWREHLGYALVANPASPAGAS